MRVYRRTGPNSGVSFGLFTGLIMLVAVAALVFWLAIIIGAVAVVAALYAAARWAVERRHR